MIYNKVQLDEIIEKNRQWRHGEDGGKRANLSDAYLSGAYLKRADLSDADLSDADLSGANLRGADLSGAYLSGADLSRADLRRADLSRAYLSGANLSGANLSGANLSGAYLSGTCIDPGLHQLMRRFVRECPAERTGGRIVYRTRISQHIGNAEYVPGYTYVAPILSFSSETNCHPGIFAASLQWMRAEYPGVTLVRCYVRDGDWVIAGKGAIRCKRLRVLSKVE